MLRYGLPETFALLRVLDSGVKSRGSHAHRARRNIDAPALKPAHHIAEPAPLVAHKVLRGYANIVKHKLSCVYAAIAQLIQLLRHAKPRRRLFHHKAAYAAMRRRRRLVSSGKHGKGVAARAVGYEHLVAVDDILFPVFERGCLQVLHIAAAARLRQRQAAAYRALRHLGQKSPLELVRAVRRYDIREDVMRAKRAGEAHPTLAQLLKYDGECCVVQSQATVLFGDHYPEQAHIRHLIHEFLRIYVFVVVMPGDGFNLALHEIAHKVDYLAAGFKRGCGCHMLPQKSACA